jgi:hypothetical protein
MPKRSANYRLVKIHRSYSVAEIAALFGVHRNTVREWVKHGLPTSDRLRPMLILGRHLAEFLRARSSARKRPCQPGEVYCVRCRVPRAPAGNLADYQAMTTMTGNLIGICPVCDSLIYRRVNFTKLEQIRGNLDIRIPQTPARLYETSGLSVNSDFRQ